MLHQYEFFCESSIRGYHAYFKEITICIGDILFCEIQKDNVVLVNEHDEDAVVVKSQHGGIAFQLSCRKFSTNFWKITVKSLWNASDLGITEEREKDSNFSLIISSLATFPT